MIVRYRESKDIRDIVLDFTESRFSADEIVKQIAQRLHDNQSICYLVIENIQLYEKGANALCHAVLNHQSLAKLILVKVCLYSYPISTDDEYFFPPDLDAAVSHFCAILQEGKLTEIEITGLSFQDQTQHHFQHIDMVEPASMRDLLMQEKEPLYIQNILYALDHNSYLHQLKLTINDLDVTQQVKEIEENIKKRHLAKKLNIIFQGTYVSAETCLIPEIYKIKTHRNSYLK